MPKVRDRHEDTERLTAQPTRARPVLLATLSVRVDPSAERMAIESAIEAGVPLIVANLLPLRPYPTTIGLLGAAATTLPHEEDLDAVRETANRAAALGVKTELLRVISKRPIKALFELIHERDAGLLVFGPHLELVGRRRFRSAARKVREGADCLVWVAPDG
jgi:hypothetical protein